MRWLRRRAEAPAPAPVLPKTRPPRMDLFDRAATNKVLIEATESSHRTVGLHRSECTVPVVEWHVAWDELFDSFNIKHVRPAQPLHRDVPTDEEVFHRVGEADPHLGPLGWCYDPTCMAAAAEFRAGRWVHHCGIPGCPKYLVPDTAPVESNVRAFQL